MKKHLKEAFTQALSKVIDCEQRIVALHYALKPLRNNWSKRGNSPSIEKFSSLHAELYEELNRNYQNLFMFSIINNDMKMLNQARKLAIDNFLSDRHVIMQYLGFDGSYSCDLEKEFRNEIKEIKDKL